MRDAAGRARDLVNGGVRRIPVWSVYAAGIGLAVWLLWRGVTNDLGPDPVKVLERQFGENALLLLMATLFVSPLRRFAGVNLMRLRRALGVLMFLHAMLHLTVWLVLDVQLDWAAVTEDVLKRPHIAAGMVAIALLLPLAATSNDVSVRRLGAMAWSRLHRLTYPVAVLVAVHLLLSVKVWTVKPLAYAAVLVALVALRVAMRRRARP